jgi:hypothetical protein
MIIEDEKEDTEDVRVDFRATLPPQNKGDFEHYVQRTLQIRNKQEHMKLKNDLIEHLWKLNGEKN